MKNLQALKQKVANKARVIVTPFIDGDVVKELANGWRKMRLDQVVTKRTNVGTAILSQDKNRQAFVSISDSDFDLYGEYLVDGCDYNGILDAIGETKKSIINQLSLEAFYPSQEPVKFKNDAGDLEEAMTKDGEPYYKRGVLAEIGTPDVWGTNEVDSESGYANFEAFEEEAVVEVATEAVVEDNDPA